MSRIQLLSVLLVASLSGGCDETILRPYEEPDSGTVLAPGDGRFLVFGDGFRLPDETLVAASTGTSREPAVGIVFEGAFLLEFRDVGDLAGRRVVVRFFADLNFDGICDPGRDLLGLFSLVPETTGRFTSGYVTESDLLESVSPLDCP